MGSSPNPATHGRRGEAGFTFSELALVLVVVTLLIVVAVVSLRGITRETSTSNCESGLRALKVATERFYTETSTYPPDRETLVLFKFLEDDQAPGWELEGGSKTEAPEYVHEGSCR